MSLLVIVLVLVLAFALFIAIPRRPSGTGNRPRGVRSDEIDTEELAQAEEELSELDAMATPEEAEEELPDWGPGAPKNPQKRRD